MKKSEKYNFNQNEKKLFSVMGKIVKAKQKAKNLRIEKWAIDVNVQSLNMPFTSTVKHSLDYIDDKIEVVEAKTETLIDRYEEIKPEFLANLKNSDLPKIVSAHYENEIENFETVVFK